MASPSPKKPELEGKEVVICIGGGVLTIILLFIFAKRQIMRFALRSRRGPHVPIGHDSTKSFKREIERRIEVIPKILYEPKMIPDDDSCYILPPDSHLKPFYCRLKAVDDIKLLEAAITKHDPSLVRHPAENLRAYLLNTLAAPLNGAGQRIVHQFCDLYEHARYDPAEFADEEYQAYSRLLLKLIDAAKLLKYNGSNRKVSPSRTLMKKTNPEKMRNILEAKFKETKVCDDVNAADKPSLDNPETHV